MSITNIADLVQDSNNFNVGTETGQALLEQSIDEVGFGRSIVADAEGNILAGNKTQLAAIKKGKQKVIVVKSDGDALVVHQRTDLAPGSKKAIKLAVLDNRVNQVNLRWREDTREQIQDAGIAVEEVGFVDFAQPADSGGDSGDSQPASNSTDGPSGVGQAFSVVVECKGEEQQQELYERMTGEGFKCRVLTL